MTDYCLMLVEYAEWRAYGIGIPLGGLIVLLLAIIYGWIAKETP